jgi:hypothetical protein
MYHPASDNKLVHVSQVPAKVCSVHGVKLDALLLHGILPAGHEQAVMLRYVQGLSIRICLLTLCILQTPVKACTPRI